MKKNLSAAAALLFSAVMYSQVGINNQSPKATLDITAKTTDGSKPEGLIAPRLTGDQIKSADGQYGSDQKGTIVYATAAVSSSSTKTANITAEGYYFFNGSVWQKAGSGADTSIYKGSGSLSGNTVVSQNANTLAFTGTSNNAFSVDGTTLSVDASTHRLGLGTTTPQVRMQITGTGSEDDDMNIESHAITTDSGMLSFLKSQGTAASPSPLSANSIIGIMQFSGYDGANYLGSARIQGISDVAATSNSAPIALSFFTGINGGTSNTLERMRITSSGNIGIGTPVPTSKLEVNGSATNTSAYDAGSSTTIDYSKSNLAYTSASAGSFTLQNIKDGGTYTLSVRGATSGTSSFTATGFTFKYVNNNSSIANTHTLYTLVVIGTVVYVYCVRGL